ncbi:PLP-dependent aminotransferase family protein [Vibrio sp. JC009]|uniref:MocR-like pyridoxine biosynthesis transcription factor PdxR n=1 Tax=Vibrio sp. JC009 TaxID=2912314 RepID=UPI0023AEE6D7|nr:PLP-dependent aminotransferase family protein [Vibrio sp. JC009]WED23354.1 PLP-dependent aminotransferase family protein [Vibrio sp. JC009]
MKSEHLMHIQFTPDRSLQEQIHEHVIESIQQGVFADNALPSCRKMASMLRVSRNTVVLVYERLVDEGYLYSQERSGYYATEEALKKTGLSAQVISIEEKQLNVKPAHFWRKRFKSDLDSQRNVVKETNWQQYPYPFLFAQPEHSLFPLAHWRECGRLAQRSSVIKDWISDSVDNDDPMLVKQLQTNVLSKRGITAKPEEILITIGTQNSLYLLADLLVEAGTRVGLEDPGYPDARNIFSHHGATIEALSIGQQGVEISSQMARCDYVYTTPSHQVPTNVTMSMDRRAELLDFAEKKDFIIIEDDFESEVNVLSQPSPALKSLDKNGRVIYVGSLSKSLSPGLRIGFMVAEANLIKEVRKLRRLMYRHPPSNNQRTCALFISLGHYDTYVRKLRNSYKDKWTLMRQMLEEHMPQCVTSDTLGGSSFWLRLPEGVKAEEFSRRAQEVGVLVEPGDIHFTSPEKEKYGYIRMGFSAIDIAAIPQGIIKLSALL